MSTQADKILTFIIRHKSDEKMIICDNFKIAIYRSTNDLGGAQKLLLSLDKIDRLPAIVFAVIPPDTVFPLNLWAFMYDTKGQTRYTSYHQHLRVDLASLEKEKTIKVTDIDATVPQEYRQISFFQSEA